MSMDFASNNGFRWHSRNKNNYDPTVVGVSHNRHILSTDPVPSLKEWYHLIGTCSQDGDLRLYIDGSNEYYKQGDDSTNVSTQLFNDTSINLGINTEFTTPTHLLGNDIISGGDDYLNGYIRYFRIWSYELSGDQVQQCYNFRNDNMDRWYNS